MPSDQVRRPCPVCGRAVLVSQDGTFRRHRAASWDRWHSCAGSWQDAPPSDVLTTGDGVHDGQQIDGESA